MSRIDDLLSEYAPNGVQVKTLGHVMDLVRGNGMPKADLTEEGVGAIHYGQIYTRYGATASSTISFVSPDSATKLAKVNPGDIIITNTSENVNDVGKAVAWLGEKQIVTGGHATVIRHQEDPKYLSYWFQSKSFSAQKRALATGTKVIDVSAKQLAKIQIPLPPLEVQREIVRILDNFTELEAELEADLEAELEARRLQYAYYRNALLTVPASVPQTVALGEIAEFKYGYTARAQAEGDYRFLRITDISPSGKLSPLGAKFVGTGGGADDFLVRPGDLLMARTGATYGKTMIVRSDEAAVYASFLIRIRLDESVMMPSYYWHFAQSELFWVQANAMVSLGGQPQFNANVLKLVKVPVPTLINQARIVALLDNFDMLANALSGGLAAELAARRKQYEYYRERLLTFDEAGG